MAKERILLTDIMLHTREVRPTAQFAKVAKKGRMYFPTQEGIKDVNEANRTFKLVIKFPKDLQDRIDRGEVEIVLPKNGLLVFPGKDTVATATAMAKKERREDVHDKWGAKNWRDSKKGV